MRFLSRIVGPVSAVIDARRPRGSVQRRRPSVAVETLEGRALLTGLAGVSVSYGTLEILAPKLSGNVAAVSIDPSNNFVKVTLNGQSEEFNPSVTTISSVMFLGGKGGGDTFTDDTRLATREYGYGSGNTFTGGTGLNYVYFLSAGNTYLTQNASSVSDVFEYGGSDSIKNTTDSVVQIYSYA